MKNLLICMFIFVCLTQSVFGNVLEKEFNYFDSLLIEGNLELLQIELENSNKTLPTYDDSLKQLIRFEKYSRVISYKKNFQYREPQFISNYIQAKVSEHKYFEKSFAGEKASISYNKFISNLKSESEIDALKFCFIADYFRSLVLDNAIVQMKILHKDVQRSYKELKYRELLDAIKNSLIDPGNNYTLLSIQDSLDVLYKSALLKHKKIEDKVLYWDSKNKLTKKWQFSIGFHETFQPKHTNLSFDFTNQLPPVMYTEILSPKKNHIGISLDALRSLSESFAIGADLMISKYTFSSELEMSLIYFDYTYDLITTHLKTVYYLRKYVGFRPYATVGLGYFRASCGESEVKVVVSQVGPITNNYKLSAHTVSSMQSAFEFGIQFIRKENSSMFFNLKTSLFLNHKKNPEIKSALITISIHLGYLL